MLLGGQCHQSPIRWGVAVRILQIFDDECGVPHSVAAMLDVGNLQHKQSLQLETMLCRESDSLTVSQQVRFRKLLLAMSRPAMTDSVLTLHASTTGQQTTCRKHVMTGKGVFAPLIGLNGCLCRHCELETDWFTIHHHYCQHILSWPAHTLLRLTVRNDRQSRLSWTPKDRISAVCWSARVTQYTQTYI